MQAERKSMSAVRRESHGHNVTADGVASQAGIYPIPPQSDTCQLMMTALMQCGGNRTKARLLLGLISQNSTG